MIFEMFIALFFISVLFYAVYSDPPQSVPDKMHAIANEFSRMSDAEKALHLQQFDNQYGIAARQQLVADMLVILEILNEGLANSIVQE